MSFLDFMDVMRLLKKQFMILSCACRPYQMNGISCFFSTFLSVTSEPVRSFTILSAGGRRIFLVLIEHIGYQGEQQ